MDPFTSGFNRALRGLRTGDRNSLLSGAALLAFALWQRNRKKQPTRELLVRKSIRPGETMRPDASITRSSLGSATIFPWWKWTSPGRRSVPRSTRPFLMVVTTSF